MYKTILEPISNTIIVKKSKFITFITPITCEDEAKEFINQIKKEHRQANHNVPVYVQGETYGLQRYSDDGEPSGTAGVPILEMLKKEGITNICCVVTRYFGGVKLGTGGLVRAYTEAVKQALLQHIVVVDTYQKLELDVPYPLHGKAEYTIANSCAHVIDTVYTENVHITLIIVQCKSSALITALVDQSNNQIVIHQCTTHGAIKEGEFIEIAEGQ